MQKRTLVLPFLLLVGFLFGQKPAYIIYDSGGKKVSYKKMIKELGKSNIVLFGEIHNNPIAHWLQYEVTLDLKNNRDLILGAEMLEADNQIVLNQFLRDSIDVKEFSSSVRLWSNYDTDYAPLVDLARKEKIPFVATNIPRRYAQMVFKDDFEALDTLSVKEKDWIAPLPIPFDSELPSYKKILEMVGDHGSPKLVKAQAIKDATMAHFILKNYIDNSLFIHFNGNYHSDYYEGIVWYLKNARKDLNYKTISTISQNNIDRIQKENKKLADFIICVDSDMTNTY